MCMVIITLSDSIGMAYIGALLLMNMSEEVRTKMHILTGYSPANIKAWWMGVAWVGFY